MLQRYYTHTHTHTHTDILKHTNMYKPPFELSQQIIGNVLALNTALINLDMGMNNIGKHGARFIATGLTKNTNLRVLRLDKNELRTSGAHFLAPVLERPGCLLEELHLFCNVSKTVLWTH